MNALSIVSLTSCSQSPILTPSAISAARAAASRTSRQRPPRSAHRWPRNGPPRPARRPQRAKSDSGGTARRHDRFRREGVTIARLLFGAPAGETGPRPAQTSPRLHGRSSRSRFQTECTARPVTDYRVKRRRLLLHPRLAGEPVVLGHHHHRGDQDHDVRAQQRGQADLFRGGGNAHALCVLALD